MRKSSSRLLGWRINRSTLANLSKELNPVFVQKWQKEAVKLEFALGQIPEKNLEERQVLVDKIQAIKEVLHASK